MSEKDWALLEKAHNTNAADNQEIRKMIDQADTEECKILLTAQYHYLYAKEEELAGVL